jgi:acyl-CoA thioesterase FadM
VFSSFDRMRRLVTAPRQSADLFATVTQELRAWPWLCDMQGHVNNARYLDLLTDGRVEWLSRNGLLRSVLLKRLGFLVAGLAGVYRRPIPQFAPFTLQTRVAAYDERWLYYEQTFLLGPEQRGLVAARFLSRGVISSRGGALPPRESLRLCGVELPEAGQTQAPLDLPAWSAAQEGCLEVIRRRDADGA